MEKVVEILRHPDCAPGTWWWTKGESAPTVSCPRCQALHRLELGGSEGYSVDATGKVTPFVICTRCDWHATIRLLGWTP